MNINQLTAIKIKELRIKTGLTAEAVAGILEISHGAYSQMEYKKLEKLSEQKNKGNITIGYK